MQLPEIEPLVTRLLAKSETDHPPVSVARIAKLWPGLQVSVDDIDGEGFILHLGKLGGQIMVKKDTKFERQRYSIAHELGHWQLMEYGIPLNCSTAKGRDSKIETWCNRFACSLLMPRQWVKQELQGVTGLELVRRILSLPEKYRVSRESTYIRVAEVSVINLIELTQEREQWRSQHYKSRLLPMTLSAYDQQLRTALTHHHSSGHFDFKDHSRALYTTVRKDAKRHQWLVAVVVN